MKHSVFRILVLMVLVLLSLVFAACGHEHAFGAWTVDKEATCTENGSRVRLCECGEKETESIPAKGHVEGKWITDHEATCTANGSKHQICSVCHETIKTETISATGKHNYTSKVTKAATCTTDGVKTYTCTVCGDTYTEAIAATGNHNYTSKITKAATCTTEGIKTFTCSTCGDSYTETIAATGKHSYTSKVTKAATCTANGTKVFTCSVCGDSYTETIAAYGHSWIAATCTDPKTCSRCGETSGKALGHNKGSDGYCTRCYQKVTIDMKTVVGNPNECKTTKAFGFCYNKNSADGIKVCWGAENKSGKKINYYTITLYFYNAVDDPAYSEITGLSSKTIKYVGPVANGEDMLIFGIVDYVPTCSKVLVGEITLEYADGTTDTGWYGWYTTYKNTKIGGT